jgi:DEAD/DEAH box helicase
MGLGYAGMGLVFSVQAQIIPALLRGNSNWLHLSGTAGCRPPDICCSAPTGSGKTLAYVVPVVQVGDCLLPSCVYFRYILVNLTAYHKMCLWANVLPLCCVSFVLNLAETFYTLETVLVSF